MTGMKWRHDVSRVGRALILVGGFVLTCAGMAAGQAAPQAPPVVDAGGVSPAELQRLFDAYALVQAQDALKLDETQFARFLPRLRALQEVRRRALLDRARVVQELRQLLNRGGDDRRRGQGRDGAGRPDEKRPDEKRLDEKLKDLRELDRKASDDVRRAVDDLDDVLDVEQRARLRLFEEQMDRRKLELLLRARQGVRARARNRLDRP